MFAALICGYGVPKNILTDQNYGMYLTASFNALFDRFADVHGTIVLSGGATDCYPPYRRTEAGEMAKWWKRQLAVARKESGRPLPWKLVLDRKALTTVENVLNFNPFAKRGTIVVFVEKTRVQKIRAFTRRVLGKRTATIIPVDFDASRNRYRLEETKKRERIDTGFSLKTLKNPKLMRRRRDYAKRKIELMRKYGSEEGHRRLPEIHAQLRKEFSV